MSACLSPSRSAARALRSSASTFRANVSPNCAQAWIARASSATPGVTVQVHDPLALPEDVQSEYGIALSSLAALKPADGVILAVARGEYLSGAGHSSRNCSKEGRASCST
jgi:hypothetical protein